MNNPKPDYLNKAFADSKILASNKQSKPLQPVSQPEQTIILDYCQNLEDLLN